MDDVAKRIEEIKKYLYGPEIDCQDILWNMCDWLITELEKAKMLIDAHKGIIHQAGVEISNRQSQLTSARGTLEKYGTHKQGCACGFLAQRPSDKNICNCGLMKALASLKEAESGK